MSGRRFPVAKPRRKDAVAEVAKLVQYDPAGRAGLVALVRALTGKRSAKVAKRQSAAETVRKCVQLAAERGDRDYVQHLLEAAIDHVVDHGAIVEGMLVALSDADVATVAEWCAETTCSAEPSLRKRKAVSRG